ncbi:hypothetical protein LIER_14165 [Lithospermum erythrorhizon]|uniref:Uncharacterized protein n=1 Tax=Lithospermum erythrorhizon TaxID=34254 RepID=A0AAV3PZQ1_LITER
MYAEIEDIPKVVTISVAAQETPKRPQSFAVTFTDEDIPKEDGDHNRPLYVFGYLCIVKISMIRPVDHPRHDARLQPRRRKGTGESIPTLGDRSARDNLIVPRDQL